jgi:hypothetical protein
LLNVKSADDKKKYINKFFKKKFLKKKNTIRQGKKIAEENAFIEPKVVGNLANPSLSCGSGKNNNFSLKII